MSRIRRAPSETGRPVGLNQDHGDAQTGSRQGDLVSDPNDVAELQLKRLQEYLAESLANPQPEIAMLGATNAGLLRAMFLMNESMEEVFLECPSASRRYEAVLRGIEVLTRVTRQFDRLEHLKLLLTNTDRAVRELKQHSSRGEVSRM